MALGGEERDANMTDERSPSPIAQEPPKGLAPGPRAERLIQVYEEAVQYILKACSYENFATCFPTPARYNSTELDAFHRRFLSTLKAKCKTEFEVILDQRNVITGLNELDTLIDEARRRRSRAQIEDRPHPTSAHLLSPSDLLHAHLDRFLRTQLEVSETTLKCSQNSNGLILESIIKQRAELDLLTDRLEHIVVDIEGAMEEVSQSLG